MRPLEPRICKVLGATAHTKIQGRLNHLHKMPKYLHRTYSHLPYTLNDLKILNLSNAMQARCKQLYCIDGDRWQGSLYVPICRCKFSHNILCFKCRTWRNLGLLGNIFSNGCNLFTFSFLLWWLSYNTGYIHSLSSWKALCLYWCLYCIVSVRGRGILVRWFPWGTWFKKDEKPEKWRAASTPSTNKGVLMLRRME